MAKRSLACLPANRLGTTATRMPSLELASGKT